MISGGNSQMTANRATPTQQQKVQALNRELEDLQMQIRAEQSRIGKIHSAAKVLGEAIKLLASKAGQESEPEKGISV